jgi:hypothetical protein
VSHRKWYLIILTCFKHTNIFRLLEKCNETILTVKATDPEDGHRELIEVTGIICILYAQIMFAFITNLSGYGKRDFPGI